MKRKRQFAPAAVAGGIGLDGPRAVTVAGIASQNINVLSIEDDCGCGPRELHGGNGFPLLAAEVEALAGREEAVFVAAVLPAPDYEQGLAHLDGAVSVARVDHIGEHFE